MNTEPANDEPDGLAVDGDPSATALNERLRNEVLSWASARNDPTAGEPVAHDATAARTRVPKQAARAKNTKTAPAAAAPVDAKKKPFGMSYDGMSQADYITYMISRGAR